MKIVFISLFLLSVSSIADAQVRVKLNYNKRWQLTTADSAAFIRVCIYDTTNAFFAGPITDLYLTGKPQMKGAYKFSLKEGEFTFYYDNGQVESTGKFESNNRTGVWKYFYRNGTPKMEAEFVPVLGDEAKIFFLNDSTGKALLKDGTGEWIEEIKYSNGITAKITGEYKNYERHGKWTFKVSNDPAIREEQFENGKFKSGVLRKVTTGRVNIDGPLEYGLYMPDKFFYTENFVAKRGVDFKTYPALKMININGFIPIYRQDKPVLTGDVPTVRRDLSDTVYTVVEKPAEVPGGITGIFRFFSATMHYPSEARRKGIQGSVYVEFVVEKDGTLTDIHVLKGIGGGCDEEAVRVVQEYGKIQKWNPGTQDGKPVPVRFVLPIKFVLGAGTR